MKRTSLLIILIGISLSVFPQKNYESEWKEVESLVRKGLPQSALSIVDNIYKESKEENNAPQFLKAAIYQIKLRADYQEDYIEASLAQVSGEIENSLVPVKQVLHSIQAELYWRYYQGNRYKLMDRTRVSNPDPSDVKTWDMATLVNAVNDHYQVSLENAAQLQLIQLDQFDPILETETGSKTLRPTLYDFLAHRALEYYRNEEPAVIKPAKGFLFDSEQYYKPLGQFAALNIKSEDESDLKYKALKLYQDMVRFHLNDKEPAALIDVDLARLKFVNENSILENKYPLYLQALEDLKKAYPGDLHAADVACELAWAHYNKGTEFNALQSDSNRWEVKTAKEICEQTIKNYPGSNGANNCQVLLQDISSSRLSFSLNEASVPDKPFLALLNYKNLSKVYFRIVKVNPAEDRESRQKEREEVLLQKYKSLQPVKQWSVDIPDEGDFQSHSTEIKIPALPYGFYVILASDNPDFSFENKSVAFTDCWITRISYISRNNQGKGEMEIFVLDRDKGTPLAGVKAQAYSREYDYQTRSYINKQINAYTSDATGYFSIPAQANLSRSFYIEFSLGTDLFYTEDYFYLYPPAPAEKSRLSTHLFTDRSIYRPGQTVYFKGIVLELTGNKSVIKPDYPTVVTFYDANYQKVTELALTTNEFGSFNGTFTAPSGGLTGEMTIRNESGNTSFSVEEYKRPRFKVEVDPLEGNYKLNETVNVKGKAMNYSGAAVDQAEVSYRVVRSARFPVWRSWWNWFPSIPETEITSGTTVTGADGAFSLSFNAIPDYQVEKKYKPAFSYRVIVDVTDINGEVHSAEASISVGYQSMLIDIDLPEKVNITEHKSFHLTTTNLNGQSVEAQGTITLYLMDAPERVIRERKWARPDVFIMNEEEFRSNFPYDPYDNENSPESWTKSELLLQKEFNSSSDSVFSFENPQSMIEGEYLIIIESKDVYGEKVETERYFTVYKPASKDMPNHDPFWYQVLKNSGEPGDTISILVGSAEPSSSILYEIENDGKIVKRIWLPLDGNKTLLNIPIEKEYRGNFFINLSMVKGNRSYQASEMISVPFTDRQLKIATETFRDKLIPGMEEEWRLRITGMNGEKVAAELLASMYDASLDAIRGHSWYFDLNPYRYYGENWNVSNAFSQATSRFFHRDEQAGLSMFIQNYDRLNWFGFNYYGMINTRMGGMMKSMAGAVPEMDGREETAFEDKATGGIKLEEGYQADIITKDQAAPKPAIEPDQPVRKNFNETAFFFPALRTDENGDVILNFTVPESLTSWKMMAMAYTKDLKTGMLIKEAVSRKELMVMTNAPRFFREGDQVFFTAKLVSLADKNLSGRVTAEFFDAYTNKPIDELLGNKVMTKDFSVEKGKSQVFNWDITIPQGIVAVICRVKASSDEFSDGEEVIVPVLPNRMLVTETLPLPVSKKGTKTFKFDKLIESSGSRTLKNYRLTLEFTSNPAWYAVQALPYLSETTHESADGIFSRYYANTLASWIANSNPKIKQVFESWKNLTPDALLSNLEKNQELKAVLLNETPWVMDAKNETERKKRIALLFDLNRMAVEQQSALAKLKQLQSPNGGWSWFEGMPDNRYITQLIVTGIGKLEHLGVIEMQREPELINMIQRSFRYLDDRIREDYERILEYDKDKLNENHLGYTQIQYLYAYSFLKDFVKINPNNREAFEYYKGQAQKFWLEQNKYMQGMIAVTLHRLEVPEVPGAIVASLKENALHSEELGMYWREPEGFFWHEAPVERQAMMIEAFSEVTNDQEAVEEMKIWLLKQKQTQDWKTSRATADAVYALLLRGTDLLASDELVEVTLGDEKIDPMTMDGVEVQAGTGFFQVTKSAGEITPMMGNVKVVKKDEGIAWGALYWQYYENLDKITPAASPLSLERELYIEKNTTTGPVLEQVFENTILKTGDKLVSRVIIRVDRDMEYVHMKDMRAAAFEPTESLSGYRYQGGLGYYESIRDASVNFYFDYLRKGTYVFEYKLNVTQKGDFSNGITSIQCLYAPEFAAHSQGMRVRVE